MCGRITTVEWDELLAVFSCVKTDTPFNAYPDWPATRGPYVDAFPRREVPMICSAKGTSPLPEKKIWGYEPYENADLVFNTRIENASTSDLWKSSYEDRHCVVPVHAFYEAHKSEKAINSNGNTVSQLYRFTDSDSEKPGDSILLLCGIWRDDRFSVITTPPNDFMKPYHPRMPLILSEGSAKDWLYFKEVHPCEETSLRVEPVYSKVQFKQDSLF